MQVSTTRQRYHRSRGCLGRNQQTRSMLPCTRRLPLEGLVDSMRGPRAREEERGATRVLRVRSEGQLSRGIATGRPSSSTRLSQILSYRLRTPPRNRRRLATQPQARRKHQQILPPAKRAPTKSLSDLQNRHQRPSTTTYFRITSGALHRSPSPLSTPFRGRISVRRVVVRKGCCSLHRGGRFRRRVVAWLRWGGWRGRSRACSSRVVCGKSHPGNSRHFERYLTCTSTSVHRVGRNGGLRSSRDEYSPQSKSYIRPRAHRLTTKTTKPSYRRLQQTTRDPNIHIFCSLAILSSPQSTAPRSSPLTSVSQPSITSSLTNLLSPRRYLFTHPLRSIVRYSFARSQRRRQRRRV